MKCAFCGKEIDEKQVGQSERCGQCPGGCRKVHCPQCGYANPVVPNFLKRFIKSEDDHKE
ncbi:MAG: hypothetical protein IBX46_04550 [Desulfuromonadales bacterium]|nr:hypothetical protein [Desulfuromonadales bacterium]